MTNEEHSNPSLYSNSAFVIQSEFDFQIEFFQSSPDTDPAKGVIVDKKYSLVKIATSPKHFKALITVMNEQLRKYEEKHGEIVYIKPTPKKGVSKKPARKSAKQ